MNNLNHRVLGRIVMGVPPRAEQLRIVAKVDELFAQTRALEARLRQAQEDVVTVNRAALHRLHTAQEDDQFQGSWHTLRDHFDVPYDDPRNVAELRQTILDLAVRGKLVPQDPNDEPASELLKRIEAERNAIGEKTRKSKMSTPIDVKAPPFRLPSGWEWTTLDNIASSIDYGSSVKADKDFGDVPILRMNNIVHGQIIFDSLKYVAREIDDLPRLFLRHDDLLFNRTNSYELVGKTGIYKGQDSEYTFASYLIRISLFVQEVEPDFINIYFSTSICRSCQIEPRITQQTGQANFSGAKLRAVLVPLPPLAEQQRIVAKVDELMRLCDELEAGLARAETVRCTVTAAALHIG